MGLLNFHDDDVVTEAPKLPVGEIVPPRVIDHEKIKSIVQNKTGLVACLSNPPTVDDLEKTFVKGEKNVFETVVSEYGGGECYDYNNFWTRLQDSWAMTSANNFLIVYGERINTLERLAQRALGEKYPGPIELQAGMTMYDVNKHFHDICQTALEKPNDDFGVSNTLKILSDGWKDNDTFWLKKKQLFVDIDRVCKENGLGSAINLWEQYKQLRDSDGFDSKEEASGSGNFWK
jgi:hypothetical protein